MHAVEWCLCLITCHSQGCIIMSGTAFHTAFTSPCATLNVSVSVRSVQRLTAMTGSSDGIKMFCPTTVTHANCIVYRFYQREQPAVSSVGCLLFISCHDVWHCCFSVCHLVNSLTLRLCCAGLPPLLHGFLQHLQHSYTVGLSSSLAVVMQPVQLTMLILI